MFQFAQPEVLYALIGLLPLIVLYVLYRLFQRRALGRFGEYSLVARLAPQLPQGKRNFKFVLICLSLVCFIVALARPQWSQRAEELKREGVDLMVALDVSNSMLAEDIEPSRLDRSRLFVNRLIGQLRGDRIGLIIFAGNAYLQVPLTSDYAAARSVLRTVSPRLAPTQGTALASAIQLSVDAFESGEMGYKYLLIISDGEDHEGEALEMARMAADSGVVIGTVGVGTERGAPVPDPLRGNEYKRDRSGQIVYSRPNEDMLRELAEAGGGEYFLLRAGDENAGRIMQQLAAMEKKEFETAVFVDFEDQFQWFVALGLLFLLVEGLLSERRSDWWSDWKLFRGSDSTEI